MTGSAHLRGTAAGAFTGALAVAAHALGGGTRPTGGAVALLIVVAAAVGAFTGSCARISSAGAMLITLAGGQVLGHLALSASGHLHPGAASPIPSPLMLLAHVMAIAVGAVLIRRCERLFTALSSVLRVLAYPSDPCPGATAPQPRARADQPLRCLQLIAVSISHRGPPAGALC